MMQRVASFSCEICELIAPVADPAEVEVGQPAKGRQNRMEVSSPGERKCLDFYLRNSLVFLVNSGFIYLFHRRSALGFE